jgi:hypothetical protein
MQTITIGCCRRHTDVGNMKMLKTMAEILDNLNRMSSSNKNDDYSKNIR